MAINFNLFFNGTRKDVPAALAARQEVLLNGAVLKFQETEYHVQILSTRTEDGEKARLTFVAYTATKHEIRYFDEEKPNSFQYIGDKKLNERTFPLTMLFYNVITQGEIVEGAEKPIFGGVLTAEEETFYATHEALKPRLPVVEEEPPADPGPVDPPAQAGWTKIQKFIALCLVTASLATLAVGAKKVKQHYNIKMPQLPTIQQIKDLWNRRTAQA
ncbi:MAG: hypothetical protein KDK64_08355 [Chlamydiia bacterium]|nr:hypothetical protein [Chlamydiia bacterium]